MGCSIAYDYDIVITPLFIGFPLSYSFPDKVSLLHIHLTSMIATWSITNPLRIHFVM